MIFKRYATTLQHDQSDCAAAVVSTVLKTYGQEYSIMKIREIIGTDMYGTTVKGVVHGLEKLKFNVKAVRVNLEDFNKEVTLPAILQVKTLSGENHFIVLHKILRKNKLLIDDPAIGLKRIEYEELEKIFLGIAIFMVPKSDFEVKKDKSGSMFNIFKQLILPQKGLFITIIFASVLLSLIGIFSSIFSKILMDEIIPYRLKNTLFVFLIVFGVVSILQTILSAFRQHILLFLSRKVDIPVLMGYYDHIIHLPYSFFSSRRTGDRDVLAAVAINPGSYMLAATSYTAAVSAVKWVSKRFGGVFGWIAGTVLGILGAQVIQFGKALAYTALYGGRDISWSWNPLNFGVQF